MPNETPEQGLRKLDEWALAELERTRRAYEVTPNWPDVAGRDKQIATVDLQIANLRKKLGIADG